MPVSSTKIRARLPQRGVTAEERIRRMSILLGFVASAQFIISGIADLLPPAVRRTVWVGVGIAVIIATIRIERFILRRAHRGD